MIVSDASNALEIRKHTIWFWKRAYRLMTAAIDQVQSLRARTLINHFETHKNSGVYFKIGNTGRKILEAAGIDNESIDELKKNSLSSKDAKSAADFKTTLRKLQILNTTFFIAMVGRLQISHSMRDVQIFFNTKNGMSESLIADQGIGKKKAWEFIPLIGRALHP